MARAEDRAPWRHDPSADPGAKTEGGAARCCPVFPFRDWHQGDKSTPPVRACSQPYLPTPVSPFHAEPLQIVPGTSEQRLQGLLTSIDWDEDDLNRQRVETMLRLPCEGDGVLILDDTGFA